MVTETWLHPEAEGPHMPGYVCISYPRPYLRHNAGRPSGGIACYVKAALAPSISIWRTAADGALLWLLIAPSFGLERPLYLCIAYIAPESSTHYKHACACDAFDTLLTDISEIGDQGDVLLAGDFNARTQELPDTLETIHGVPGLDGLMPPGDLPSDLPPRRSLDPGVPSPFGHKLLALCQSCNLYIMNGRVQGDAQGALTCYPPNGSSLVDYVIASTGVFSLQPTLKVHGLQPESDHCPLTLCIQPCVTSRGCTEHAPIAQRQMLKHYPERAVAFREVLASAMHTQMLDIDPGTQLQLNIAHAARVVHGVKKKNCPIKPKPWFDADCMQLRNRLQRMSSRDPRRPQVMSAYKRLLRSKRRQAQHTKHAALPELALSNPAAFWQAYRAKKTTRIDIPLEQLAIAFQNLLGPTIHHTNQHDASNEDDNCINTTHSAERLNANIAIREVQLAFKRLRRRKAAGIDGIKAEHLLDASDLLLQPLADTFSYLLHNGVPAAWCQGVIHPIFKAGPRDDPSNYRGITVTPTLSKLYAMVLEGRLTDWAEQGGLRATGQSGFRRGFRTVDNVFILQTLLKQTRKKGQKLYCCFVDFKKAFDSIPRQQLWEVLKSKGVTGSILHSLKSMYAQDTACVLTQEGLSGTFACTTGVKQGCPASPLLFGLYLDDLETLVMRSTTRDSPTLPTGPTSAPHGAEDGASQVVPPLLFADDLCLTSLSMQGLQEHMDTLQAFCNDRGLVVNLSKTKLVVFQHRYVEAHPGLMYDGRPVEQVQSYKFLGLQMHGTKGLTFALSHLKTAAGRACFALQARCTELEITDIPLRLKLFDALVRPVMSYGCEVWAPLASTAALMDMERVHVSFLRRMLGVPQSSPIQMIYAELGRLPCTAFWWKQALSYMSYLHDCSPNRLVKRAYVADRMQALGWGTAIETKLHPLGQSLAAIDEPFDCAPASSQLQASAQEIVMQPSDNHLMRQYFVYKTEAGLERYLQQIDSFQLRCLLTRFRFGQHWLQCHRGRFQGLSYEERVCNVCVQHVDSEQHALFDCPKYEVARFDFPDLFREANTVAELITRNPPVRVAHFLRECQEWEDFHSAENLLIV